MGMMFSIGPGLMLMHVEKRYIAGHVFMCLWVMTSIGLESKGGTWRLRVMQDSWQQWSHNFVLCSLAEPIVRSI